VKPELKAYINEKIEQVNNYLKTYNIEFFAPQDLFDAAVSYPMSGGKRLRPVVAMLCAGIFGGKEAETTALPVACGAELFHNWTLIHDDIIDNDDFRRGQPTAHKRISADSLKYGMPQDITDEYGRDIAILAGDRLHALSICMMSELRKNSNVDPRVALEIISMAENEYVGELITGEAQDVCNGMMYDTSYEALEHFSSNEDEIISMMRGKTGILYAFCCVAGGMIGLNTYDAETPVLRALKKFAIDCGIAFQLQDDILGIVSDEKTLGKPVGSDIREGKKTTILTETFRNSDECERALIARTVGNKNATKQDVEAIKSLFYKKGGIKYTEELAQKYIRTALESLKLVPDNEYKELLVQWADYMTSRKY